MRSASSSSSSPFVVIIMQDSVASNTDSCSALASDMNEKLFLATKENFNTLLLLPGRLATGQRLKPSVDFPRWSCWRNEDIYNIIKIKIDKGLV